MKIRTVLFTSATIGLLFAVLAINLLTNWSVPRVYAQDSTQQQSTTMPQTIHARVQNVIAAGTERTDSFGIKQVYVPAGCFMMGSDPSKDSQARPEEQPQHQVCITKAYWLDEFDVTNAAFDAFAKAGGYTNDSLWQSDGLKWNQLTKITGPGVTDYAEQDCVKYSSEPNQPRVCVSYYEADAYAKWRTCRLPTEAEWEYAARGTTELIYPWGDIFDSGKTNTSEGGLGKTTAVDAYPTGKSWVGAYDMAGNVGQWVADWADWHDEHNQRYYYSTGVINDPTGATRGTARVVRGGSWVQPFDLARTAFRGAVFPGYRFNDGGFRAVCAIPVP